MMRIGKTITCLVVFGLPGLAIADDKTKVEIDYAVEGESHEEIRIELDSDDLGFNLHDLQEGENRSIVDKEGRTILVTREADGFRFDVEGKSIQMPMMTGDHDRMVMMHTEHTKDVDVKVMRHSDVSGDAMGGTMIITGKPVDEATQQAIRSLLESTGHGSEVHFIDHSGAGEGPHQVKVVKKVEVVSE